MPIIQLSSGLRKGLGIVGLGLWAILFLLELNNSITPQISILIWLSPKPAHIQVVVLDKSTYKYKDLGSVPPEPIPKEASVVPKVYVILLDQSLI